ncbi:MAG: winged helix-turn-helix domain-containing protein [Dethiobacteria bacterium]
MSVELKAKIWLETSGEKIFGDGPCDILKRVERTGSLRQTAAEINMSYSHAWKLIRMIENNLGFAVLEKQAGGAGGGHSNLTPRAAKLTRAYDQFRSEAEVNLMQLYSKHLSSIFDSKGTAKQKRG